MKLHQIENADAVGICSDDDDVDFVGNTGDDNIDCVIGMYVSVETSKVGMYHFLK